MRIVITGATGLIGRNLLFEFVKREFNDPQDLNVIVLGRPLGGMPIRKRVHRILLEDGLEYIDPGRTGLAKLKDICGTGVKALSIDISKDGLGLSDEDYRELKKAPIDIFFHLAASTDLRPTPAVEKTLLNENIEGTRRILELVSA
ncbi:MAG: SDR family oxidoreductase, partial [Candidatus Omnitrophica bacterium]|nr:SDR family oxidoreductase [Candidatus Omnitrophota bacterium]